MTATLVEIGVSPGLLEKKFRKTESVDSQVVDPAAFTGEQRRSMFDTALVQWQEAFTPEKIETFLSRPTLSDKQVHELKAIRLKGQQLAALFKLFDERQGIPEPYANLLRAMGKIKDVHTVKNKKNHIRRAKKHRTQVREALAQIETLHPQMELHPVNDGIYRERVSSVLQSIADRANQETLRVTKFHDMRKDIRSLHFLFRLAAKTDTVQMPENQEVLGSLNHLNQELGNIHDGKVSKSLNGGQKYKDARVRINDRQREDITDVLSRLGYKGRNVSPFY